MNVQRLVTVAIAATLLIGGLAAVGAAAPADQAPDTAADASENAPAGANDDRADDAGGVGPSDGLPEQVPDHVSAVHETIESFLNGSIDGLGGSLSDLLGDGAAADGNDGAGGNERAPDARAPAR